MRRWKTVSSLYQIAIETMGSWGTNAKKLFDEIGTWMKQMKKERKVFFVPENLHCQRRKNSTSFLQNFSLIFNCFNYFFSVMFCRFCNYFFSDFVDFVDFENCVKF